MSGCNWILYGEPYNLTQHSLTLPPCGHPWNFTMNSFAHSSQYSSHDAPAEQSPRLYHPLLAPARQAKWGHTGIPASILRQGISVSLQGASEVILPTHHPVPSMCPPPQGSDVDSAASVYSETNTVTVGSLVAGSIYAFQIRARNERGYGPYSNTVYFTTLPLGTTLLQSIAMVTAQPA